MKGFTLIEVLVAFVVMAAAIAVLAQGFATGAAASVTAQNRTRAAWQAETKMTELEAGLLPMNLSQGGVLDESDPTWRWAVRSEPTSTAGLTQLTVTVAWKERGEERSIHLVRLMRERP
ncbi:MAG: type II secretion system protein [Planctomycetes bacterium]|nr:type II secretion system protein [Planctomycetota bacterium]